MNLQFKKTCYSYVIPFLLVLVTVFSTNAQTGPASVCKNGAGQYTAKEVNFQIRWRVFKFITPTTFAEVIDFTNVATINLGGGFRTWIRAADKATITFQAAGKYRIQSERRGWWYERYDDGNDFVNTDVLLDQPAIDFVGINNVCSGATLKVVQPQAGATYTWNTVPPTVDTMALYTFSSGVTQAFVTVTAAACPGQSAISNSGDPRPPSPLGGSITGEDFICRRTGQVTRSYSLTTTQCSNPITWGSSNSNVLISQGATSGTSSNATYTFPTNGSFGIFADITGFGGVTLRIPFNVEVVSKSDPRCNGEAFRGSSDDGDNEDNSTIFDIAQMKQLRKGNALLYPNPVSDVLRLDQLQEYSNLRVIDQYGKVLTTQPIVEGETAKSLNVSQFANGLYLIQFTNKTGDVTTKKFQVIH
jgi:Secretion system C-terminal sorting domain